MLEASTAIALSTLLCYLGQQIAVAVGFPSASISIITLLTVALATAFARPLQALAPAGEGIANILLQVQALVGQHVSYFAIDDTACSRAQETQGNAHACRCPHRICQA